MALPLRPAAVLDLSLTFHGGAVKILVIQGNPDPAGGHFGHALAASYAEAATAAGHEVRILEVAKLDFPLLQTSELATTEDLDLLRAGWDAVLKDVPEDGRDYEIGADGDDV